MYLPNKILISLNASEYCEMRLFSAINTSVDYKIENWILLHWVS